MVCKLIDYKYLYNFICFILMYIWRYEIQIYLDFFRILHNEKNVDTPKIT